MKGFEALEAHPLLAMAEIPEWLHFTRDIAAAGMELTDALQEDPVLH